MLDKIKINEWFEGKNYFEDLVFDYRVVKKWKLAVISKAIDCHYPASIGRGSSYDFGKQEVTNRICFMKNFGDFHYLIIT